MKRKLLSLGASALVLVAIGVALPRCGLSGLDGTMCDPGELGGEGEAPNIECPDSNDGCQEGLTGCEGVCISATTVENCGFCGNACDAGDRCGFFAGRTPYEYLCVEASLADGATPTPRPSPTPDPGGCGSGLNNCGTGCVDLMTSEQNCGACGIVCSASQNCVSGLCTGAAASPTPTPSATPSPTPTPAPGTPTPTPTPTVSVPSVPAACAVRSGGRVVLVTGSLQEAVNSSPDGSVLVVPRRTINESVNVDKSLTIVAEVQHEAILNGNLNVGGTGTCVIGMRVSQLLFLHPPSRDAEILDNSVGGCIPNQGSSNNRERNSCDGGFGCTSVPRPCNNGS